MTDAHQANIDLMNRYSHALDTCDWALLADLFTADAVFAAREVKRGEPDVEAMELTGREAIVTTISGIFANLSATHHMLSNYVVDLAPDCASARASCYMRAHHVGNRERAHLFEESLGRFDFETVLDAGAWRIARMDENIFIILGTAEAFGPQ